MDGPWRKSIYCRHFFTLLVAGCNKKEAITPLSQNEKEQREFLAPNPGTPQAAFTPVVLVSDAAEYSPLHLDPNLGNAWGIAVGPTGALWVASNHKGLSTIYDRDGNTLIKPVSIPL